MIFNNDEPLSEPEQQVAQAGPARPGSACREEGEPGQLSGTTNASLPSDGVHLLPSAALKLAGELIIFSMPPFRSHFL